MNCLLLFSTLIARLVHICSRSAAACLPNDFLRCAWADETGRTADAVVGLVSTIGFLARCATIATGSMNLSRNLRSWLVYFPCFLRVIIFGTLSSSSRVCVVLRCMLCYHYKVCLFNVFSVEPLVLSFSRSVMLPSREAISPARISLFFCSWHPATCM